MEKMLKGAVVVEFVVPIDVCLGGLREAIKYLIRTDA
jgi:hypothetical protein